MKAGNKRSVTLCIPDIRAGTHLLPRRHDGDCLLLGRRLLCRSHFECCSGCFSLHFYTLALCLLLLNLSLCLGALLSRLWGALLLLGCFLLRTLLCLADMQAPAGVIQAGTARHRPASLWPECMIRLPRLGEGSR